MNDIDVISRATALILRYAGSSANWLRQKSRIAALPICFLASWCHAQDSAPLAEDSMSLETVIVESSVLLESGARVELDRSDVVRTSAVNLGDVLTQVPNVKVQTNSRGEQVFALRGSDQRQVALTLDGASVVSSWDGQLDLSLLPSSAIESIAITRSPASVLQEPIALLRLINVVSRRVEIEGSTGAFTNCRFASGNRWKVFSATGGSPFNFGRARLE